MKRKKPAKKRAKKKEPTVFEEWAERFDWPKGITFEQKKLFHRLWWGSATVRKHVYKKFRKMEEADARRVLSFIFSHDTLQNKGWRQDLHENTMTGAAMALWKKAGPEFTEKTVVRYLDRNPFGMEDKMPFFRFLSRIGGRESGKAIVRSMLYSHREVNSMASVLQREKIGEDLEALAFRLLPKGNMGRLRLLKRYCRPLGALQGAKISLVQFAAATDSRTLKNLPNNLKDSRQRTRIDYLRNTRRALEEKNLREVAETLKLIEPLKKK